MPNVKVTTSLAGENFSYAAGQVVEEEIFAAQVGSGWEGLCSPVDAEVDETAVTEVTPTAEPSRSPAPKRKKGSNA